MGGILERYDSPWLRRSFIVSFSNASNCSTKSILFNSTRGTSDRLDHASLDPRVHQVRQYPERVLVDGEEQSILKLIAVLRPRRHQQVMESLVIGVFPLQGLITHYNAL